MIVWNYNWFHTISIIIILIIVGLEGFPYWTIIIPTILGRQSCPIINQQRGFEHCSYFFYGRHNYSSWGFLMVYKPTFHWGAPSRMYTYTKKMAKTHDPRGFISFMSVGKVGNRLLVGNRTHFGITIPCSNGTTWNYHANEIGAMMNSTNI